ncbi:MAG: sulfatase [Acidobacteriota bacterium]|jgi:arylsulfatase A-like enzyme
MNDKKQMTRLAGVILLSCLGLTGCFREGRPPNVLMVVVDTLRADHVGSYADVDLTPNLDAFARDSIVFLDASSTAPNTINSAPSILTSTYPSEHQFTNYRVAISPQHQTLAEILAANGYQTFAVSANPHVTARNGLAQGFETFLDHPTWTDTGAGAINQLFFDWLDSTQPQTPFFALLWCVDPHTPYEPPADILDAILDDDQRALVSERTIRPGSHDLSAEEREVSRLLYEGEVRSFDRQFGLLMEELRHRSLLEDTIIVFTSDHGESFWEHTDMSGRSLVGHGVSLFRTEIAVPLMIRFPGSPSGRAISAPVSTVDIVPTVLAALDIEVRNDFFQGHDLMPLSGDESDGDPDRRIVSELYTDFNGTVNFRMESVRSGAQKLVVTHSYRGRVVEPPLVQLFDTDDREIGAGDSPQLTTARENLLAYLRDWRESLFPLPAVAVGAFDREDELIERLRALGYLR